MTPSNRTAPWQMRGSDVVKATAALVFFMGLYELVSQPTHIRMVEAAPIPEGVSQAKSLLDSTNSDLARAHLLLQQLNHLKREKPKHLAVF